MFPAQEDSARLLENLSESFSVEVKRWIDPKQPDGQAKVIKALLALRNNGGGRLVIGFDNESMRPVSDERPPSVRAAFAQDDIQALATRFSSIAFEVLVQYIVLGGDEFPVICVPSGLQTPVATKSELKGSDPQRPLVPLHAIYVRTLSSNNTVSTALAQWRDWERLVGICFDSREADIGRFVRRHLSEDTVAQLASALSGAALVAKPDANTVSSGFLDIGRKAFDRAVARTSIELPTVGYFEISTVIAGDVKKGLTANQSMLNLITSANRHLTGWPLFVALNNADLEERRPKVVDDAWESAIIRPDHDKWGFNGIDFWRIQPDGKLYAIRAFYEDFDRSIDRGTTLAIVPAIRNVADGLAEAVSIAKQMTLPTDDAFLAISLRWTALAGRSLSNAFSPRFWSYLGGPAVDDVATISLTLPIDLPDSALAEQVRQATAPLFRKFQGFEVGKNVIDAEVQDVLKQ